MKFCPKVYEVMPIFGIDLISRNFNNLVELKVVYVPLSN